MAAGTRLVSRPATTMTAIVTTPTAIACHCHWPGETSDSQKPEPLGMPSSLGPWLPTM